MKQKVKIINIEENAVKAIKLGAALYFREEIFIYPTDTIYGVGGNPFSKSAVEKINKLKHRKNNKKFILLINNVKALLDFVMLKKDSHFEFLKKIWPAPVSVVLRLNDKAEKNLNAKTAAFRIPKNKFCIDLLNKTNAPIISTSVNKSSGKPLNNHLKIAEKFHGDVKAILYTNKKLSGAASTLIDLTGKKPVLIREGRIKFVDLLQKFT